MAFKYEKQLREFCKKLKRDHVLLSRELDKIEAWGDPAERKILRAIAKVEREMYSLERIINFPQG